jgi:acyl carrier protein
MSEINHSKLIQTSLTSENIQDWLVSELAKQLEVDTDEIDVNATFDVFGLDSAKAMVIIGEAEKFLGFEVAPTLLWHYPTIQSLSERLAEEAQETDALLLEEVGDAKLDQMLTEIEQLS